MVPRYQAKPELFRPGRAAGGARLVTLSTPPSSGTARDRLDGAGVRAKGEPS
jgi:hypothetical protein